MVSVQVARGAEKGETKWEEFSVPFVEGMSVLDGLIWIREHIDPALAFRYSCINANACKECSMMIDGEVAYACTTKLTHDGVKLKPLEGKDIVRDLVTDIAPSKERLSAILKDGR